MVTNTCFRNSAKVSLTFSLPKLMLTPSGQTPACMFIHTRLPLSPPSPAGLETTASFVPSSHQLRSTVGISSIPMSEQIITRKLSTIWMFCRKHRLRSPTDGTLIIP